jgi:hypothetical protein
MGECSHENGHVPVVRFLSGVSALSADHKKPSYAFAGLVVLAASVVGIQVRADADLSQQATASRTVLHAAAPDHGVASGPESPGPTSTRAADPETLDGLQASPWGPGSTSSSASGDAGVSRAAGRPDRAVAPSRSGSRAHAHVKRGWLWKGHSDGSGRSGDADRGGTGHGAEPRHRSHEHDRGRGHR